MKQTIQQIIKDLYDTEVGVVLTRPDAKFGDFSTNIALQLAGRLGENPRQIAETLAEKLRQDSRLEAVEVAGPGFINLKLSSQSLLDSLDQQPPKLYDGQKIVFEYSCPNAFKELHTGHLYQTIIGDILARLIERSGAQLSRTSFGGDVGLHVAKCLWGMVAALGGENPAGLSDIDPNPFERARWISSCYVAGAKAYEEDADVKQAIDNLNKTIYGFHAQQDHESPLAQIYWQTRQWSFDYFAAFYDMIKVDNQHYYPESLTAEVGLKVVEEQLKKGNLKHSDGAVVFEGDESKHLHTRVFVTSQGLPTYETKDIGVIWKELEDYGFENRILITGNDQKEYMRVVFAAAEIFRPELTGMMTHLTNGTVKFGDGQKMSSRLGNVARAADVIEAVRQKVRKLVDNQDLVEGVTLGAVKYVFAKYKFGGNIAFDVDETVSLVGNSGPYLQYAHARARSILRKSSLKPSVLSEVLPEDRALVKKIGEYSEVIEKSVRLLEVHHICNYLFELAQEFNRYYEHNVVIGSGNESHRLALVEKYADTLQAGLDVLGIVAPDKM